MSDHPTTDLYRAMQGGITSDDGKTLTIRLAPHDQWAEIQSVTEGHFMERFSRSAYKKTMADRPPKILFQHGKDNSVGQQPIAILSDVGEDADGAYYRAELLDGIPPLIEDGLKRGVYGSSYRFRVIREEFRNVPSGPEPNGALQRTRSARR